MKAVEPGVYDATMHHSQHRLLLVGMMIVLARAMLGAAPQTTPATYFEGQPVVSVHVLARPDLDIKTLLPLARQKAGEPYSQANIKASVAAFMATGKFTRVDVDVEPVAEGLDVRFILQPAFYVGLITFPGADIQFNYGRLLPVVDYPATTPYEKARAEAGKAALKRFFTSEGYFGARVEMVIHLDSVHRLADISYDVSLGRRARIGRIVINGPPPSEAKRIEASLRSLRARIRGGDLKSGKPYYPSRIRAASTTIQDYLGDQGWLASQVTIEKPEYNPQTNLATVSFLVVPGPKVEIRATGAKISRKTLRELVPVFEEKSFDQDLVEEGERNLISYFQAKGFFDVKINPEIRTTPAAITLDYAVERGRRHRVISVAITGSRYFEADDLMANVVVKKARFFSHGEFSNDLLTTSVSNLVAVYHDAGYEEVKVTPEVVDLEPKIEVTFRIDEGPQTVVSAVKVEGMKKVTLAALAPGGLEQRAGQPYSPVKVAQDRSRLVASYLNLGYESASCVANASPAAGEPHRVDITYEIKEGVQSRIDRVVILGEKHTRRQFIQKNISVKPGAPLSEGKMLGSESALYDLGVFDWASVDPAHPPPGQAAFGAGVETSPDEAAPVKDDVLVKVHEGERNSINYGGGFQITPRNGSLSTGILALPGLPVIGLPSGFKVLEKSYVSPLGSVEYSRRNLRGRGETASVSALVSRLAQRATITYSDPEFSGLDWSSLFSVSVERSTQNPLFTARFGQASYQIERTLNASKTEYLQLRYSFGRTTLTNLLIHGFINPGDQSIHSSTLSASLIRDTRDKPLDAHRGIYQTLNFGVTPAALGSSDSFARFFGQTAWYHQVRPWMVLAESVRVGVEAPFAGSHIPLSERFFSGGADSLRGFPINGAGPQTVATLCTSLNDPKSCTAKINVPVGGPQLFILNSEGRFPLPIMKNLGGVIFYDGGNVYNHVGFGNFFGQYSNTVGLGLRYNTPVGPIRLDIGRNLSPVPGNKAIQIYFTIGQAF
ncbi:MAG: BamA/TamA family outer membrane protein [Acidobacteriota bacterium]|nr:BamA/TamA family outer membrane protein [Acidobacteriota bacterium]